MFRTFRLFLVVVVAGGLTTGTLALASPADAPLPTTVPTGDDCFDCQTCPSNPNLIGTVTSTNPDYKWIDQRWCPNGLMAEGCEQLGECDGGGSTDAEDVQQAVKDGDAHNVLRLLRDPGVVLVAERSAIQIMDCAGDHVAYQVSIEPHVLRSVVDLQQDP